GSTIRRGAVGGTAIGSLAARGYRRTWRDGPPPSLAESRLGASSVNSDFRKAKQTSPHGGQCSSGRGPLQPRGRQVIHSGRAPSCAEDLPLARQATVDTEVRALRRGIRQHRDSTRHELCWHHPALWGLLPEKTDPVPVVLDWSQFIQGCVKLMSCSRDICSTSSSIPFLLE